MRSKHIAALITFFAAFAFSAFIALLFAAPKVYQVPPVSSSSLRTYDSRCSRRYGEKIRMFLDQDKQNGAERRSSLYFDEDSDVSRQSITEEANSIAEYSNKSGSMDAGKLPSDFQSAWNSHMLAWSKYAEFMQKAKTKKMDSEELYQRKNEYIDDINSTWDDVLETGRGYGADLPAGF